MDEKLIEQMVQQKTAALTAEYEANKRIKRAALIKLGAMCLFISIVLVFMTVSWFTMSREVGGSDMSMATADLPFDIATKGAEIRNTDVMSTEDGKYVLRTKNDKFSEGASGTYTDTDDNNDTYYVGDSLLLRYDTGETVIAPGGNGALDLYVIPRTSDALNLKITLDVVAFAEIEKKVNGVTVTRKNENNEDVPDTDIIEITDAAGFAAAANAIGNTGAANSASDYVKAAKYLRGHILFFGGEGDTADTTSESLRYFYTTPYTARAFNKTIAPGNGGKAVQVPIYWMWSNTLGQIALPDNTSGKRNGYPVLSDNDTVGKTAVVNYLKTNAADIFTNNSANTESYITSVASASSFDETAFRDLSSGYNRADFEIGTKIAYFMIEVTVGPA